jgi:hypothetical protein
MKKEHINSHEKKKPKPEDMSQRPDGRTVIHLGYEKAEDESKKTSEQAAKIASSPEATRADVAGAMSTAKKAESGIRSAKEIMDKKIERLEKERSIKESIDFALNKLKDLPPEKRMGKEDWIIRSVTDALDKKDDDWKVVAEGQDEEGQPAYKEKEGVPVEGLIDQLDKLAQENNALIEAQRNEIRELEKARINQAEAWIAQGDNNPDTEHQLKMSWHAVYNSLPAGSPLRQEIDAIRNDWLMTDRQNQNNDNYQYNDEEFAIQTGEAFRQAIIVRKEKMLSDINEVDDLIDHANVLDDNSRNFYDLHPEIVNDSQKLERRKRIEAKYISEDVRGQERRSGPDLGRSDVMEDIMKDDYFEAEDTLKNRKEIVLPDVEPSKQEVLLLDDKNWRRDGQLQIEDKRWRGDDPLPIEDKKWRGEDQKQIGWDGQEIKQIPYEEKLQIPYHPRPEEAKKVRIVNIDEIVRGYAMRLADEKVRQLLHAPEEGMRSNSLTKSVLNNIYAVFRHPVQTAKKSWLRVAENAYRQKFYIETLRAITENQNLMLEIEAGYRHGRPISIDDPNMKRDLNFELLDKVIFEYSQNVAELEEKGNQVNDPGVQAAFQDLVYRHATEGWSRQEFENEQRNLINDLKGRGLISNEDFLGTGTRRNASEVASGMMYASNLFKIAEDYKTHVDQEVAKVAKEKNLSPEQAKGLAEHVRSTLKLDVELGAKFSDLHNKRPAGTLHNMERFVNWAQTAPIIRRIASNPGSIAFASALIADQGAKGLARRAAKGATYVAGAATGVLLPIFAAAGMGGVFGYFRRSRDMKHDRAMHQNQRILGKEYQDHRRNQMERYQYDIRPADELQQEFDAIKSTPDYNALNDDQRSQLTGMYARFKVEYERDLEYRTMGGQNRTVDLISVNREDGGKYGTNYMAKTDLKAELYQYLRANHLIPPDRTGLPGGVAGALSNADFNRRVMDHFNRLNQNIEENDRQFESYRRRSSAKMGILASVGAGLSAAGVQELSKWWTQGKGYTALDHLRGNRPEIGASGKLGVDTLIDDQRLAMGHNRIKLRGETFDLVMKTGSVIDEENSVLPKGWSLRNNALVHRIPGIGGTEVIDAGNFKEWAKSLTGQNMERISYAKHLYAETPPEKGVRTLRETFANLFHNKKLNANLTELMMQYDQDDKGRVIMDASKMFGQTLKASAAEEGFKLEEALASGKKVYLTFSLDNVAENGTQFTPIKLEVGQDGKVVIPENLKNIFFGLDADGNLMQGPRHHFGLHTLVIDTGETRPEDGAHRVYEIASVYGGKEPNIPNFQEEIVHIIETPAKDGVYAGAAAATPRWQMESEREEGKKTKQPKKKKEIKDDPAKVDVGQIINDETKPQNDKIQKIKDKAPVTKKIDQDKSDQGKEQSKTEDRKTGGRATSKAENIQDIRKKKGSREGLDYHIEDESKAEAIWQANKGLFGKDKIIEITGIKTAARLNKLLERSQYHESSEKGDKMKKADGDDALFNNYFQKFLAINPGSKITFPEFNHCLRRGLWDAVNEKPRRKNSKDESIKMAA